PRLGAGLCRRPRRLVLLPHPFRRHRQGRHRPADGDLPGLADAAVPIRQHAGRRAEEGGLVMQTLRRMNRGTLTVIGIALAVVCFLAVNLFATLELGAARLDLTANRLYTLSDSTAALLKAMKEPVKLRLYASRLLLDGSPGLKPYAARVRETLASYVKLSGDRISLEIIDPEPFSPEDDRPAAFALPAVPYHSTANRA